MKGIEPFSDDPIHFPGSATAFAAARAGAAMRASGCDSTHDTHSLCTATSETHDIYSNDPTTGPSGARQQKHVKLSFSDVWHAAKTDRNFDYVHWINVVIELLISHFMKHLGRFMVVVVVILILFLSLSGLLYVAPRASPPDTTAFFVNITLGVIFLFNILLNYYLAVSTDPGGRGDAEFATLCYEQASGASYCHKCQGPRPPRAHHCSVCDRCVLKMDHHCPFINNCVGQKNYAFFCRFLLWTTLCTTYLSAIILPQLLSSSFYEQPSNGGYDLLSSPPRGNLRNGYGRLERLQNGLVRPYEQENDTADPSMPNASENRLSIKRYVGSTSREPPVASQLPGQQQHQQRHQPGRQEAGVWDYIEAAFVPHNLKRDSLNTRLNAPEAFEEIANQGIVKSFVENLIRDNDLLLVITFLFSTAVAFSVGALCLVHVYLVVSGQTSIEMSRNQMTIAKMNEQGRVFFHHYDKGWRRNIEQVFGTSNVFLAVMPSLGIPNSRKQQ